MDLVNKYKNFCTVGELLDYIKKYNIPMDAKILMQRIEDDYFEDDTSGNKRELFRIEGESCNKMRTINSGIANLGLDEFNDYPNIKEFSEDDIDALKEEYYPCWSPVYYEGQNHLFLDANY